MAGVPCWVPADHGVVSLGGEGRSGARTCTWGQRDALWALLGTLCLAGLDLLSRGTPMIVFREHLSETVDLGSCVFQSCGEHLWSRREC